MTAPSSQKFSAALVTIKALVVEDDEQGAKLISMVLKKLGIPDPVMAADGAEAIEALKSADGDFDLIISDWNMPKVSGEALLKHVRENYQDLPFIMITGRGTVDAVLIAQKEGVTSFINKPYKPKTLSDRIVSILNPSIKAIMEAD